MKQPFRESLTLTASPSSQRSLFLGHPKIAVRLALKVTLCCLNGSTENVSVPKLTVLDTGEDVLGFVLDVFVVRFTYTFAQDDPEIRGPRSPHPE